MTEPDIQAATTPNPLTREQLRLHSDGAGNVRVDPSRAAWRYLSFRALSLAGGAVEPLDPRLEHVLVVVHGADVRLEATSVATGTTATIAVPGRASAFVGLPGAAYVPVGWQGLIRTAHDAAAARSLIAIASAPSSGRAGVAGAPLAINPADIAVEVRGAGNATRQIHHIVAPDFPADRLELVEVLTPSGNWSSWPPHKHDTDNMPTEAVLEEIYYYQFGRPEAWAMQRLYRADRSRDCTWEVRSGDVVLVTDGYHPFVAAHGDDAYYLNALAGDRRTMACSYDPDLDWVRSTWADQPVDPRLTQRPSLVIQDR